jgi:UrcA family protein
MDNRLKSTGVAALSFSVSAALLAFALTPAMASAAPIGADNLNFTVNGEQVTATKRVSTADLDLTSASDLRRLDARIGSAVREVCRGSGKSLVTISSGACDSEARRSADRQVAALRNAATSVASATSGSQGAPITIVALR